MALKDLLVTFVTGEEARVTPGAVLRTGSLLSVVVIAALLTLSLSSTTAYAYQCCWRPASGCANCCVNCASTSSIEITCPGQMSCYRYYRTNCQEGCTEEYIQCYPGYKACTCAGLGDC